MEHEGIFQQYLLWASAQASGRKCHNVVVAPCYWVLLEFLTLILVHSQPPAIQQWQFRFSCTSTVSPGRFSSWVSAVVSCHCLFFPLWLPVWRQWFALRLRLSYFSKSCWLFQVSFFLALLVVTMDRWPASSSHGEVESGRSLLTFQNLLGVLLHRKCKGLANVSCIILSMLFTVHYNIMFPLSSL